MIPSPTCVLRLPGGNKGCGHCARWGIKVFQNPQISTKTPFTYIGVGEACTLSLTDFETTSVLLDQATPKTLVSCLGLQFSVVSLLILSLADVPAKLAGYPAAEANLYVLILYDQCNGPILLVWGEEQRQVPSYHPRHGGAMQTALGKHLKGLLLFLLLEGKLILVIRNLSFP